MRITIDATTQGSFITETLNDAYNLLETMAFNNYQWQGERSVSRRVVGLYEVDGQNLLNAKIDMLTKKLEATTKALNPMFVYVCEQYGGGHSIIEYQGNFYSSQTSIE